MVIKGNIIERRLVEARIPQGSLESPCFCAMYTSGLMRWLRERVSGIEGLSFVDDVGLMVTGGKVSQVFIKLESCARESIHSVEMGELGLATAQTEAALLTHRGGHKKHRRPKLTAKILVGNSFVRFNNEATRWLGVWMAAHLTFKEHHDRCMKKARAAEARLRSLT